MKKRYLLRRNGSYGGVLQSAMLPLGICGAFVFILIVFRLALPGVFVAVATPFWQAGTGLSAGVGSVFTGFDSKQQLAAQNVALASEVSTLKNENAVLTARAQDLTKLLGGGSGALNAGGGTDMILEGVLARPPESPYDTIVVQGGSSDGIDAGARVFGNGGIPIGSVQSVTVHSAVIKLLSTAGVITDGWVGSNRTPISLTGTGAGTFTATLAKAATPSVGDEIYVPGPGSVPIGTVAGIVTDPSSPTVQLRIQPFVNIFSITWVEVARAGA